jgi:predicted nucleotide-binding protein
MQSQEELLQIADNLATLAERGFAPEITEPIRSLNDAVNQIDKSFSGSWLGYHANVYYKDLKPPPPGEHFSQEWGLERSSGYWIEYDSEVVKKAIYELAGNPDLGPVRNLATECKQHFEREKAEILSILISELSLAQDAYLESLKSELGKLKLLNSNNILQRLNPTTTFFTRDTAALGQGIKAPPHMIIQGELIELNNSVAGPNELNKVAIKAGSHLARSRRQKYRSEMVGTNVFIGHGRSSVWKDLKDFINDRLALHYDEFNRVPVAGITNIARLSEMLDSAAIAFIILTGEDEQADGKLHARLNAVHEAGLFQGRLGFTKSIILLEEGCEEFSNIHGLGQVRFPKGNISAIFEDIRLVIERELGTPSPEE